MQPANGTDSPILSSSEQQDGYEKQLWFQI